MGLAIGAFGLVAALIQLQGDPLAGGRLTGSVRLPLERASGGDTPVLTFTSQRGTVRLLLDTGATSSMLTPGAAERLGLVARPLPRNAFALSGGGSGCERLQPARAALPDLTLRGEGEGVSLRGAEALVLEVAALPSGVDGVLGAPSLRQLPIRVDPPAGRLSLGRTALGIGRRPTTPPRQTLPLEWRRGVPVVRLTSVSGPVEALADSGAEGLFLSPALAARLHPLGAPKPLRLVGFCGEQTVRRQPFAGLGLPGEPQEREAVQPVEGIVTSNPIFGDLGVEAILGQELLRRRVQLWRLDAAEPRLELW
ncbi:MAG: aspartyl protease family protein [Cyanobacteriota bacterium]